jgi:UDP-N-acetyl-D-galactosamine dehydrogenase
MESVVSTASTWNERIAVIGLGYVGLPVALAFARKVPGTVGFDVNTRRVDDLRRFVDKNGEESEASLREAKLEVTADTARLADRTFFIVAVPTPIDAQKRPDLTPLVKASETVGKAIAGCAPGVVVVFESTVYPGVTEEVCGPVIEKVSGKKRGVDFFLGYSPERINPGDKEHTLEKITKVVSGENPAVLERVAAAYGAVVVAGIHKAPTIMVAEAAKVIENTQRDLNIALMNELALIFDKKGIKTRDVLEAAGTKWNFLKFFPGLVGGHCIGVDPYYLTTMAEGLGYHPQVILAGRRINDGMGAFVAQKLVKLLVHAHVGVKGARVAVLGLTFKENVPDLRNSRVPDIIEELRSFGIDPMVHDPVADPEEALHEYGLTLVGDDALRDLDAVVVAVNHATYNARARELLAGVKSGGVIVDVKGTVPPDAVPGRTLWSL